MPNIPAPSDPLTVLILGGNGYLGTAISRAFLRTPCPISNHHFGVYPLVRRASFAPPLAALETTPIVIPSLSPTAPVIDQILTCSQKWDIIVVCTEPSRDTEQQHWDDVLKLINGLAEASTGTPLVLWSSGCKDYGQTDLAGSVTGTVCHSETSVLNPHPIIRGRMEAGLRALEQARSGMFDVAVIRASPVFGYSGSYYGAAFDYAAAAAAAAGERCGDERAVLKFSHDAGVIMHGMHVDDCADAYVALANYAFSSNAAMNRVRGEVFNISGRRYETLGEVGAALAKEYGFAGGARFGVSAEELGKDHGQAALVFGWSQWVGSQKIRDLTGWCDFRPLFAENVGVYRRAYEAAREAGDDNVGKIRRRMAGNWGGE